MADLFNYLNNYKNKSFNEASFNIVDIVILSQLSYLNYELYNFSNNELFLYVRNLNDICKNTLRDVKNYRLFLEITSSYRYDGIKIVDVESVLNDNIQYCAMTFIIKDIVVIVYRGTDLTINGWKEDLLMGVDSKIDSYDYAYSYLVNNIKKYDDKDVYVCGHSKGGNLVSYVVSNLNEEMLNKIKYAYNLDGPGFYDLSILENYKLVKDKLIKIVPRDDIVGLLLNNESEYKIIDSKGIGVYQHDLYNWKVINNDLKYLNKVSLFSSVLNVTNVKILDEFTLDEKKELIDIIDMFFKKSEITDLNQIRRDTIKSISKMIMTIMKAPFKRKKFIIKVLYMWNKEFFKSSIKMISKKNN